MLFNGVANTMGPHSEQFALPQQGDHVANASFEGEWYYSQAGDIDVSLSRDGSIEARFNVSLAHDELPATGEPAVFRSSEDPTAVSGVFKGRWILSCHSRLPGHSALVPGGEYCDNLMF